MSNLTLYFRAHRYAYQEALRYLKAGWFGSVITLLVIAVALALPWGLLLVSRYAHTVFEQWNHQAQIVLYLQPNLPQKVIYDLKTKLQANPQIANVNYISPEMGLAQLERREGFKDVVAQLDQNPLPPVLEIEPNANLSPVEIDSLAQQLQRLPLIEQNQINVNSIKQLYAVLEIAKRFIYTLAILLGIAVMLIIGNTLRLIILQRSEEINVMKLVGASMAYTRRPYLYIGFALGAVGGLFAWGITFGFFSYLTIPLQQLNPINQSILPTVLDSFLFLTTCSLLGWLGAMVAAQKHLKK